MKIEKRNFKNYLKFKHNTKYVHQVIYDSFLKKEKNQKNKVLIDIGCGGGSFIKFLYQNTMFNLIGTETDKGQLEYCKKSYKFANFFYDDVSKTANKRTKNFANIICACGVNQIFDDHNNIIKNELSRLKRGGKIIIQGIFCSNDVDVLLKYKLFKNRNTKKKNQSFIAGWNLFSTKSTKDLLLKNGAKSVKIIKVKFPISLKVKQNKIDPIRSFTIKKNSKEVEFRNVLPIKQDNYIISAIKK